MRIEIEQVNAAEDRAVVELEPKKSVLDSGLHIIRENHGKNYYYEEDYEIGVIRSLGDSQAFAPAKVGDRVIVRAASGGEAGADIGLAMGWNRGEVIVVEAKELVCIL